MKKIIVLLMFITISFSARADYAEIVETLKYVETNNTPHLVGDNGASWGVLQIQEAVVLDVNRYFGTSYTHEQMFKPACAEEVALLYMQMGAERYRKRYGKEPTEEVLVRNHNGGIYQGYRINDTREYWFRYRAWKRILKARKDGRDILYRLLGPDLRIGGEESPRKIQPIWN